jgi:phenylacetate-CoA ligase
MLFEHQSELFRQAFGVPILNMYGGRELSVMAFQPREGAPLRVLRPWLFLEIVDREGKPVRPGESGRLLWTSTVCRGTPFLRYEIGDLGSSEAASETEAGIAAIRSLDGRTAGTLMLEEGTTIHCLFWNHLFKEIPEIQQFQVVIRSGNRLRLLLKGTKMSPEKSEALLLALCSCR